jgi:transaldolase
MVFTTWADDNEAEEFTGMEINKPEIVEQMALIDFTGIYTALCRASLLIDDYSALHDLSKRIPEKDQYEIVETLSDERKELEQEAENLEKLARQLRCKVGQYTQGIKIISKIAQ